MDVSSVNRIPIEIVQYPEMPSGGKVTASFYGNVELVLKHSEICGEIRNLERRPAMAKYLLVGSETNVSYQRSNLMFVDAVVKIDAESDDEARRKAREHLGIYNQKLYKLLEP